MIHLDGKEMPWHDGMTVADLLRQIGDSHPYAVVRVNETVVSQPKFDTYQIPDQAEISLIPMIAGG
jgi:thiamine biosynthesis protein ThiS